MPAIPTLPIRDDHDRPPPSRPASVLHLKAAIPLTEDRDEGKKPPERPTSVVYTMSKVGQHTPLSPRSGSFTNTEASYRSPLRHEETGSHSASSRRDDFKLHREDSQTEEKQKLKKVGHGEEQKLIVKQKKSTQHFDDDDPDLLDYLESTTALDPKLIHFSKSVTLKLKDGSGTSFMSKKKDYFSGVVAVNWLMHNYPEHSNRVLAASVLSTWHHEGHFESVAASVFQDDPDSFYKFKGECLKFCLGRRSDFKSTEYQGLSAKRKFEDIMLGVCGSTKPKKFPNKKPADAIHAIEGARLVLTPCDDLPITGKKKLIHSTGVIATARFDITANPHHYTGVLGSGSEYVILRFSSAYEQSTTEGAGCLCPSLALKFLRTGIHSANTFAMYTFDGQDTFNFFEHDLSTHPPEFHAGVWKNSAACALKAMHSRHTKFPTMLGLSDLATYDSDGKVSEPVHFPYRLIFHPATSLHYAKVDDWKFEDQLIKLLGDGLTVFDVYAQDQPLQGFDTSCPLPALSTPRSTAKPPCSTTKDLFKIGEITLTSNAMKSSFGDKKLHFQHVLFEEDVKVKPAWGPFVMADQVVHKEFSQIYSAGFLHSDIPWK